METVGNHQVTAFRCLARRKTQATVRKNKAKKAQKREEKERSDEIHEKQEAIPNLVKIDLDIRTNWAVSPGHASNLSSVKDSPPENAQHLQ